LYTGPLNDGIVQRFLKFCIKLKKIALSDRDQRGVVGKSLILPREMLR